MKLNKRFWKRWSSWGNFLLVIVPAIVTLTVDLGLDTDTQAAVAMIGGVIVTVLQSIKQEATEDETT